MLLGTNIHQRLQRIFNPFPEINLRPSDGCCCSPRCIISSIMVRPQTSWKRLRAASSPELAPSRNCSGRWVGRQALMLSYSDGMYLDRITKSQMWERVGLGFGSGRHCGCPVMASMRFLGGGLSHLESNLVQVDGSSKNCWEDKFRENGTNSPWDLDIFDFRYSTASSLESVHELLRYLLLCSQKMLCFNTLLAAYRTLHPFTSWVDFLFFWK